MFDLVWQPYVLSLGGSLPVIGSFVSVWTIVSNGLQFITGEICDAKGRKLTIQGFYMASIIGFISILAARDWVWLLPGVFLFSIADSLAEPGFNPLFAESVDVKKIGLAFSLMGLTWSLPGLYSKLLAGYLGQNVSIRTTLWLILLGEILGLIIFQFTVKETLVDKRRLDFGAVYRNVISVFKPDKEFKNFYILASLDRFAWELNRGIFVAMIYKSFNFSLIQIGILMTVTMASTTIALVPTGSLVDKFGSTKFLQGSEVLAIMSFVGCIFVKSFPLFIVIQVLRGLAMALWDPAYYSLIAKTFDENERGTIYGKINGLKGLITFPAPILGAFLYSTYGFGATFSFSVAVSLMALLFTFKIKTE